VVWAEEGSALTLRPVNPDLGPPPVADLKVIYDVINNEEWYAQGVVGNDWQAESVVAQTALAPLYLDWIDWGDNLESKDWNLKAPVRVETVLYVNVPNAQAVFRNPTPDAFVMASLGGTKREELFGTNGKYTMPVIRPGDEQPVAGVYTRFARITIQKVAEASAEEAPLGLVWFPETHLWVDVAAPMLTYPPVVDVPIGGGYSAEVNGSGRVIYGYNWKINRAGFNDGVGIYRVTFSLEPGSATAFDDETEVYLSAEGEESDGTGEGGVAEISVDDQLTYIDVRIKPVPGGGGGKK
jgi:hypothetical protein